GRCAASATPHQEMNMSNAAVKLATEAGIDFPVYDADHHYYEPPEAFLKHLPKQFRKDFQYVQVNGRDKLVINGMLSDYIPNPTFSVVAAPGSHEDWYRGRN